MRGSHRGESKGIAPTGNEVEVTGIFHFSEEGKVRESWDNFDALGMIQQLGIVPEAAQQG